MPDTRTIEDHLRSEYVQLLPAMQKTLLAAETEVRHLLLEVMRGLQRHERIIIRSRVKECESAIDALRRRQKYGLFDPDRAADSLTVLPDLVGIRVLTFPRRRLEDARRALSSTISDWLSDEVPATDPQSHSLALKYSGRWSPNDLVRSEIQVVSLLVGLFWEVEHSAIYKPTPNLRGAAQSLEMKRRTAAVETALHEFESEFERLVEAPPDTIAEV